jgi:histidine ammonia-lyase
MMDRRGFMRFSLAAATASVTAPRPYAQPDPVTGTSTAGDVVADLRNLGARADLTLEAFRRCALDGERIGLSAAGLERVGQRRDAFERFLNERPDVTIYGVTSGYGAAANLRFTEAERQAHARLPQTASAASFGPPLPRGVVRGFAFARLTNFIEGDARGSPRLLEHLVSMLNADELPPVPAGGQIGAGDILALSHLFGHLPEALALEEKEGMALLNGCPCPVALVAHAAVRARLLYELAMEVTAYAAEAFLAPLEAYDPRVAGNEEEARVCRRLIELLAHGASTRRPYQAPISLRALPQWHGAWLAELEAVEARAEGYLRKVTDNPLIVGEEPKTMEVLSNGGFYPADAHRLLDRCSAVYAEGALLCERIATALLDGEVSGLPDGLTRDRSLGRPLTALLMTMAARAAEARKAATTTLPPASMAGGGGQNDLSSPAFPAFFAENRAYRHFADCLAGLAFVSLQAFAVTGRAPPPALEKLHRTVTAESGGPVTDLSPLGPRIEAVAATMTPYRDELISFP